jgi:hypothetical protein
MGLAKLEKSTSTRNERKSPAFTTSSSCPHSKLASILVSAHDVSNELKLVASVLQPLEGTVRTCPVRTPSCAVVHVNPPDVGTTVCPTPRPTRPKTTASLKRGLSRIIVPGRGIAADIKRSKFGGTVYSIRLTGGSGNAQGITSDKPR